MPDVAMGSSATEGTRLDTLLQAGSVWRAEERGRAPKGLDAGTFLPNGLPRGTVHEWFSGSAPKTAERAQGRLRQKALPPLTVIAAITKNSLAALLKRTPKHPGLILWIGESCWPTPHLLKDLSTDSIDLLSRSLFIAPRDKREKLWSIDTALRSPGAFAVIAECESLPCSLSKRLSLAAKHGGTMGFIVRKNQDLYTPSAAMTRWYVKPITNSPNDAAPEQNPRWDVELLRSKGMPFPREYGSKAHWVVEVSHEKTADEIPLPLSSLVVDGFSASQERVQSGPRSDGEERIRRWA